MIPSQFYLFGYNAVQFFGWSFLLVKTALGLSKNLTNNQLYNLVEFELQFFQTLALLEVVNAAASLVRSPIITTVKQVASRVSIVWLVLYIVELSRHSLGVPLILIAWSITEVVRYSFYALTILNKVPVLLQWMRYTFFIVLYPMGALGEILIILAALPEVAVKKHLTLEMPNAFNFAFSYWWFLVLFAGFYPIGFPSLYLYMLKQRTKILCVEASKRRE